MSTGKNVTSTRDLNRYNAWKYKVSLTSWKNRKLHCIHRRPLHTSHNKRIGRINGILRWHRQHAPQHPLPAVTPCHGSCSAPRAPRLPRQSAPEPGAAGAAWLWWVRGRRLRMRQGRASGVPWGDGLGKGDLGRRGRRQAMSPRQRFQDITVSALNIGGWFDGFLRGTMRCYEGMRQQGATALTRAAAFAYRTVAAWTYASGVGGAGLFWC